jgi:Ca2+-binding EF-hand superfamily protein
MEPVINQLLNDEEKFNQLLNGLFKDADFDGNKTIDCEEFNKVVEELCDQFNLEKPSYEELKNIFEKIDLNNDGIIEFDEFKVFLRNYFKEMINS